MEYALPAGFVALAFVISHEGLQNKITAKVLSQSAHQPQSKADYEKMLQNAGGTVDIEQEASGVSYAVTGQIEGGDILVNVSQVNH